MIEFLFFDKGAISNNHVVALGVQIYYYDLPRPPDKRFCYIPNNFPHDITGERVKKIEKIVII